MLGGFSALAVSFFVFPARAQDLTVEAAARLLDQLARALRTIVTGFSHSLGVTAIDQVQNSLGEALAQLEVIGAEARRERITRLAWGPDPGPLLRTLIRLRHDLVMIGKSRNRTASRDVPNSPRLCSDIRYRRRNYLFA